MIAVRGTMAAEPRYHAALVLAVKSATVTANV